MFLCNGTTVVMHEDICFHCQISVFEFPLNRKVYLNFHSVDSSRRLL
jgi:hypothetical protein